LEKLHELFTVTNQIIICFLPLSVYYCIQGLFQKFSIKFDTEQSLLNELRMDRINARVKRWTRFLEYFRTFSPYWSRFTLKSRTLQWL